MEIVDPVAFLRDLLAQIGLEGVSALTLVVLLSLALYAHKGARYGGKLAYAGSRATSHAKVTAVVLVLLLVVGVIQSDVGRVQQLMDMISRINFGEIARQVGRWLA